MSTSPLPTLRRTAFAAPLITLALIACTPKTASIETPAAAVAAAAVDALPPLPELDAPLPIDPDVRIGQLDNGLTYYIEANSEPTKRAVLRLVVDTGSILEDDDQLGLAHFVEHMAFNGTEHFPGNQLIEYLESVGTQFGAHLNAHTSFDETVYKLQVPTDDAEILDTSFLVFRDWAGGLSFDSEEIEKERGVVLEEWRRREGVSARTNDQTMPVLFHGSPYHERLPIGTDASLKTFDPDALRRFYTDWYRPDLMTFIAVGDFDPDYVEAQIREQFSNLTSDETVRPRTRHDLPDHEPMAVVVADPEHTNSVVTAFLKHDDVQGTTHRSYRESFMENMAMAIVNERLAAIAQQPNPPFLGAGVGSQRLTPTEGTLVAFAATVEGGLESGLDAVWTEVERVRRFGVTQAELDRARANALRGMQDYYDERETTHSRTHAEEIVRVATTGESMPGVAYEYRLAQAYLPTLTTEEVNAHIATVIQGSLAVMATLPENEAVPAPTSDALLAIIADVQSRELEAPAEEAVGGELMAETPEPGSTTATETLDDLGLTVWTLSNGATVIVKPTDFKADEVRMRAFSHGGHAAVADADYVSASTAADIGRLSGLGEHDAVALGKLLAGKQAMVSVSIGHTMERASGTASVQNIEELLQLTHLAFTAPRFDPVAFERSKTGLTTRIENRLNNPNAVFSDALTKVRYDNHPRRRAWTLEDIDQMNLDRAQAIYGERFANAGDFTFFFVGSFDPATLQPLVEQYLASLPATDAREARGDDGARLFKGQHREVVRSGTAEKASVRIHLNHPYEDTLLTRHTSLAVAEILTVRLRKKLREELGGTYSVSAAVDTYSEPVEQVELRVAFQCDPERVEELTAAAWETLRGLRESPPTAEEVSQIQEQRRRNYETNLEENRWWLNRLYSAYTWGDDPVESVLGYPDRIQALTPASVHDAAQWVLDETHSLEMIMVPENAAE